MHDQFYWPHMAAQVKEHIDKCNPCLTFKARQPKAPLENIVTMHLLDLVHLDCPGPGNWKRPGREWFSGDKPFYLICPILCYMIPDCPNNGQSPLGQFCHPLWVA